MASNDGVRSGVSTEVGERPQANKETGEMVSPVAKPTVEYDGYERTITDVVRIRQETDAEDETGVSQLMVGLDDAIKTCRSLRVRLERLHKRRNTGFYHQSPKTAPSQ
jgi:hypothetical protein